MDDAPIRSPTIVAGDDVEPVSASDLGAPSRWLIVCDHAGRRVPAALGRLGLPEAAFDTHIAWDIGAADLSRRLGAAFAATVIAQRYSRLVIDCNRDLHRSDLICEVSDGVTIPRNQGLTAADVEARVAGVHAPYHAAIAREIDGRMAEGRPPHLLLVHSFTPRMGGIDRPWRFGVLHADDSPLSEIALAELRREDDAVGDNQPYAMDEVDYTAPRHAGRRRLQYLELEVRQDLLADAEGQARVAALLSRVLPRCLERLGV